MWTCPKRACGPTNKCVTVHFNGIFFLCKEIYMEYVYGVPARAAPTGYLLWEKPPLNKRTSGLQWYYTAVWEKFRSITTIVLTCENIMNMSHLFLRTYTKLFQQAVSGSGAEARSQGCGGINNDLKCFARFCCCCCGFCFLLWFLAIISSSEKSHLCHHSGSRLVKFPQCAALAASRRHGSLWPRTAL